ncbi:MAG: hypothetical protein ABJ275_12095 [Maricaulaceae bacterium]
MSFELISELTRWAARLSLILFALAFLFDGFRTDHKSIRTCWAAYSALMLLYFTSLIIYHLVIRELPSFDLLNGLLSLGVILFLVSLWRRRKTRPTAKALFAPIIPSYYLAFLYTALPISRILPAETNHPIYHIMLYGMGALFMVRIALDIKAHLKHRSIKKSPATL